MPKVKLTTSDWDWILMLLNDTRGYVSDSIIEEINNQLAKQEH
jgi:hypothetical protein